MDDRLNLPDLAWKDEPLPYDWEEHPDEDRRLQVRSGPAKSGSRGPGPQAEGPAAGRPAKGAARSLTSAT